MTRVDLCNLCGIEMPTIGGSYTYTGPVLAAGSKRTIAQRLLGGLIPRGWVQASCCTLDHLLQWLAANIED